MNTQTIFAGSIFTTGPSDPGKANAELFFTCMRNHLEDARSGKADTLVHCPENASIVRKLALCESGAIIAITLTKNRSETAFAPGQQLRGWIGSWIQGKDDRVRFAPDDQHVDEFGEHGLFQAYGSFFQLVCGVEKYLANGRRRFEDDQYVIWI